MKDQKKETCTYNNIEKDKVNDKNIYSNHMNINLGVLKISIVAVFTAAAIVLSIFESLLPALPFLPPGAKLGISNVASMSVAGALGIPSAMLVAVLKSLFVGLTRGFTAFLMSFFGSVLSTLVAGLLLKLNRNPFGFIGIGILGALTHNMSQLAVAYFLTGAPVFYYLPIIVIASIIFGSVTGLMLKIVLPIIDRVI